MGPASDCLLVTQHRAQQFPNVNQGEVDNPAAPSRYLPGQYDRIVCDVPCSGDGTMRKAPDLWRRWHPSYAISLHSLQVQIAMRGLALLRVGGLMAYSTCSLNPVENEAVVAALLNKCGGAVEIVDVAQQHPDLKRCPGLQLWTVMDDDLNAYATLEQAQRQAPDANFRIMVRATLWPPDNVRALPLERCMRIYPHLQDTGGFFVAILRKVAPLPGPDPTAERPVVVEAGEAPETKLLPPAALAPLAAHFGLRPAFSTLLSPYLFGGQSHVLRFATPALADHVAWAPDSARLKKVAVGVKLVEEGRHAGSMRLTQAGARLIYAFAESQVVQLDVKTFRRMLYSVDTSFQADTDRLRAQLAAMKEGPCLVVVRVGGGVEPRHTRKRLRDAVKRAASQSRNGLALHEALFGPLPDGTIILPGQVLGGGLRLRLCIHYSKGLEVLPRAVARALLKTLPKE